MDFLGRAQTLVRIVEAGSLSSAARSLGISLAAVSRQVASLEEELGSTLLARTTRRLELTDAGRRFHEHAVRLVREAEAARESVRIDRAIRGRFLVSASVTLGVLRIIPFLPPFLAAHPALDLALRLEDRPADVIGEGVDLVIRSNMALPDTARLVAQPLASFERVIVAAPSYLARRGTPRTFSALSQHDAVLGTSSNGMWQATVDGASTSVTMKPRLRIDTLMGVRSAVVAGLGLAILPAMVVEDDLREGSLRAVLPDAQLSAVSVHALYRVEARGTPRIDAVLAHLRATVPFSPSDAPSPSRGRRSRSATRR